MSFEGWRMVFTPWHYLPSAASALLIFFLALRIRGHKRLGFVMAAFAVLGLAGYIFPGNFRFYPWDFHVLHSWLGFIALMLSVSLFLDGVITHSLQEKDHCRLGYAAAAFALFALLSGLFLLSGWELDMQETASPSSMQVDQDFQQNTSGTLPEVEANMYQGKRLMPLAQQGNNAILGVQHLDNTTYRLVVTGLVKKDLRVSYKELLALPAYSEVAYMPCVEGWGFEAKWTGFRVADLLNLSGLKQGAVYVIFQSADGYSTGLPLEYLQENRILLAYGINDVTLPEERGFPLQLVAKSRYGYKWAKWITKIEVVDEEVRGYWESRGYSNSAKVGEIPFG
jgi:DMSO/TMAO reductase YedYZ molybdopterin-dependent catalytic subunit